MNKRKCGRLLALVVLLLLPTIATDGQQACCEGDVWLHWTNEVRTTYVFAYQIGYAQGFETGCTLGAKNVPPPAGVGLEKDPAETCRRQVLNFSKGAEYFATSMTDFYTRFPADRGMAMEDLIKYFAKNLTAEQIHQQHGKKFEK